MKKMLRALLLIGAVFATVACDPPGPPAPPDRFGLEACNQYLPGSKALADIDAAGVPIVCEQRLAGAPSWASGWYNGTIHIWPQPDAAPNTYVLKVAPHEFGHHIQHQHPDWDTWWQAMRSTSTSEEFPEAWAWCNYPRPATIGYVWSTGVAPSSAQCQTMQGWHG